MVAAQQFGTLYGRTIRGAPIMVDVFISDVANEALKFDSGAGASSASQDFVTFNDFVHIYDLSLKTGLTDTTKVRLTINGQPVPSAILRYANHVNTLNNRPALNLKLRPGSRLGGIQLA